VLLLQTLPGCPNSKNIGRSDAEKPVSVSDYEQETIFMVEKEPEQIENLPGLQRVVLKAQKPNGLVYYESAFIAPPGDLRKGQEVEVRLVKARKASGFQHKILMVKTYVPPTKIPVEVDTNLLEE
jgi:hypothetical protein